MISPRLSRYGTDEAQSGDLYLPDAPCPPVVCLLHGGFWRMPHGRDQFDAIACDLATRGFAVWNIGYRRLGAAGGGWPGTFEDVAAAIDHLAQLVDEGVAIDPDRVVVAGHSAGGQLALWVSARRTSELLRGPTRVRPVAAAALAGVVDLAAAHALGAGNGAVDALLGGAPDDVPDRYATASPMARVPLGIAQLILHGTRDEVLPRALSHDYAKAALAAGDHVEHVELAQAGHMDFLDPDSRAHSLFRAWLARVVGASPVRPGSATTTRPAPGATP